MVCVIQGIRIAGTLRDFVVAGDSFQRIECMRWTKHLVPTGTAAPRIEPAVSWLRDTLQVRTVDPWT